MGLDSGDVAPELSLPPAASFSFFLPLYWPMKEPSSLNWTSTAASVVRQAVTLPEGLMSSLSDGWLLPKAFSSLSLQGEGDHGRAYL